MYDYGARMYMPWKYDVDGASFIARDSYIDLSGVNMLQKGMAAFLAFPLFWMLCL